MAKDAGGHGSEGRGMSAAEERQNRSGISWAKHARANFEGRSLASRDPIQNPSAHSAGVAQVGQSPAAPNFHLNSYTHEIVSPTGDVSARMKLGKNNGLAVDEGKGGGISRSGGPSIHDAVAMPDYLASEKGGNSFPADHISGALHFLTGNAFAGHTVRRVK